MSRELNNIITTFYVCKNDRIFNPVQKIIAVIYSEVLTDRPQALVQPLHDFSAFESVQGKMRSIESLHGRICA